MAGRGMGGVLAARRLANEKAETLYKGVDFATAAQLEYDKLQLSSSQDAAQDTAVTVARNRALDTGSPADTTGISFQISDRGKYDVNAPMFLTNNADGLATSQSAFRASNNGLQMLASGRQTTGGAALRTRTVAAASRTAQSAGYVAAQRPGKDEDEEDNPLLLKRRLKVSK